MLRDLDPVIEVHDIAYGIRLLHLIARIFQFVYFENKNSV